jgi:hypothetical protein
VTICPINPSPLKVREAVPLPQLSRSRRRRARRSRPIAPWSVDDADDLVIGVVSIGYGLPRWGNEAMRLALEYRNRFRHGANREPCGDPA